METTDVTASTVLPENHEDQLQLGFRLIHSAWNKRMSSLEQEAKGLRLTCEEQRNQAAALQRKNLALEGELMEGHQKAQQMADENKELFKTVAQLRRHLSRLEGLKKSVLDSIADHQQAEVETEDNKLYLRDDYLKGAMPLTMAAVHSEVSALTGPVLNQSGTTSPTSQAPLQASGTPTGDAAQPIDGKQFFKKARASLSYQAFTDFLANIKQLNNQQQTREETLEKVRSILGHEQQQLYGEFEQLLNRQGLS